jgi:tRNA pseudouridine38-40 synthase
MTEPTLYPEGGFLRLRLDLAYDGTQFSGWGKQPDRRTVQSELESALQKLTRIAVDTVVAGRTDAGVHATGQVVHVDIPEVEKGPYAKKVTWNFDDLPYRVNRILDEDVQILKASIAPPAFHARFSALRRHYQYKILDSNQVVLPLRRFDVAPWYRLLDVNLMNQASQLLLGQNNFAAFCKFRESATTIRTLETFSWVRDDEGFLVAEVVADAFCYSMVRNLVGAVVCVGDGRFPVAWVTDVLNNRERISDSLVFPSRGLTFRQVDYPTDEELLARSGMTMRRRVEDD